jgi:lipopolysaccharide transport system permease protein
MRDAESRQGHLDDKINSDNYVLTTKLSGEEQIPWAIFRPPTKWRSIDWTELWNYRELLYFFVWRDLIVRYKQSVLGALWEIIKPFSMMIIYTICLGYVVRVSSDGLPYPLFFYSGILLWGFFSQAMNMAAQSVLGSSGLLTKIYFPRLLVPLATVLSSLFDLVIASLMLLLLMIYYNIGFSLNILVAPLAVLWALITALGMGLIFAAVIVQYRDFQSVIALVTLLWMFMSPVFYPASLIPNEWILLYSVNPMVGAIELFRWAFFGKADLEFLLLIPGMVTAAVVLLIGLAYFSMRERSFADWL